MTWRIIRPITLAPIFLIAALAGADTPTTVLVRDGSELVLRLRQAVSSATAQVEDAVLFEVAEPVVVEGVTVIEQGAEARGKVTLVQHKKGFGRRGKLDFSIDIVRASDGQNIRLRAERSLRGTDSFSKAAVVTILTGPFGIFVKGKDVEAVAGSEYRVYIDGDRRVAVAAPPSANAEWQLSRQ